MNDAADLVSNAVGPRTTVPAADGDWPVTNCYIDAWMQVLRSWGLQPLAGLGVTVAQDYEGDQFTFFKYLHEDLETLYGVVVGELAIWQSLEAQVATQVALGHLVLVEVDGYYLPDTRATAYRIQHTKTTIAIDAIDPAAGRLCYFHNIGRYELTGEDYAAIFRKLPAQATAADLLQPYVEFVRRRWPPLRGAVLRDAALASLRRHLRRRPEQNPVARYRADFADRMDWLMAHPDQFHEYAFCVFRQLGANFELLAAHINWLADRGATCLASAAPPAAAISAAAKALQFKAARIASRRRFDPCDKLFDAIEANYVTIMNELAGALF